MSDIMVVRRTANPEVAPIPRERTRYPVNWPVLLVCCMVAIIACIWLLYSARNYQETLSLQLAHQQATSIYGYVSPDNPMPLYYLAIHFLDRLSPLSLTTLRLLSLLCFAIMLPIAYLVGVRAAVDKRVGLLAAALIGLSPFMVWFGSRATVYTLLALFVLLNAYFFVGILQRRDRLWPGYILTGFLGLALHYFFIVVLLTQFVFWFMELKSFSKLSRILLPLSTILATIGLGYWIYSSSAHGPVWNQLPFTSRPSATNVFIIFLQFLFGFQAVETITFLIALWPLLVILALLAVQKYVKPPVAIRYFAVAAFLPVTAFFVLGWITKPLFLSSYLIICLSPFMMVVAWYLIEFELPALVWARNVLLTVMAGMLLLELANTQRAISGDYLGVLQGPVREGVLNVEAKGTSYHPALTANSTAYEGHQAPAAGPPLQVPSDSPGVLTQRK